ncbi:hypothetical protein ABPG72_021714 [Tetrahymena utriculariae]
MMQKVCLSPWCEDTDRIINEKQIKNISLHKHDEGYIVSLSDITEKKQCYLDIFSRFQRKLSDFTFLLLTTQNSLKNIQVYQNNYNDIHHFVIKQCLKISQYYQSFHKECIEMQVRNLIIQYDSEKENKKSILIQINQILSIDNVLEKRVFEKIMDQFKIFLNSDEIKQYKEENKEQFKIYLEQRCNKIIEMRSELINNLLQDCVQLSQDSNSNQYCLNYFQKLTIFYNQEELKLLEDFKSKLIESLLFLVGFFSSQYDVQSTFQCFYEIYSIEIQNKDILDSMIKTLKKFDVNYQERIVQILSLITFSKNKQVLDEFFDKCFPTFSDKNNVVDKIQQLSDQPDQKKILLELLQIFQNELNDQQLSQLLQQLLNSKCINSLIQKFFLSFLSLHKNIYFTKGIPTVKILNDSINFQDVFSYSMQKQAERKEKNLLKENEKKKLGFEKASERKNRRNNQEKKFENFRQLAKQRRNLLGFLLQTDLTNSISQHEKNDTQSSQNEETIKQTSQNNKDQSHEIENILESIHNDHEYQRPCLQNSIFLVNSQIMSDSKLIDENSQNCQNHNQNQENENSEKKYEKANLRIKNKQSNELFNEQDKNQFQKSKQSKKIKKQKQKIKKEDEVDYLQDKEQENYKCQQDQQVQLALPEQEMKENLNQYLEIQDISANNKVQNSLEYLIKEEEEESYSQENLCKNLCENPFDQESFLRLFNCLDDEQLVQLCKRYKQIMAQILNKREMNSQLLSFFSASSYFYLDKLLIAQFKISQNLLKLAKIGASGLSMLSSAFCFNIFLRTIKKHWYICYHNLNDKSMALILFNQGFQFIKNNNLLDQISNQYFTQLILDYCLLNYRIGNLEKSKYLLKSFFDQNPTQNIEIAYYLNALINFKLGDFPTTLNQLQALSEPQNISIKIENQILRGFIYMYHLKDTNLSKQQYQQAWEILCNSQVQNKFQKQIRVLKKLIYLNDGIGFYQESEYTFIKNLSRNAFISYLQFLFDFAVQKYNDYIKLIIFYHQEQQADSFIQDFTKNHLQFYALIQLFQNCFDHNYRKVECMYMIGKCNQDLLGQDQQSLQCYNLVLKIDPYHFKSMLQILNILVNNQNYEQANIILQKIENLQFQSPQKTYLKAKMFQNQGKFQFSLSLYFQLLNSQNILLSKSFYQLIQKDYSFCQQMIQTIQENSVSNYIQ